MPRKPKPPPKPKRRAPNTGSVMVRKDGRVAVYFPKDLAPKRLPVYGPAKGQSFTSAAAATAWLDAEVVRRRTPHSTTLDEALGSYLARWWKTHAPGWPSRTAKNYARMLKHFGSIGDVTLRALMTHDDIRSALAAMQTGTWRRKKRNKGGALVEHGPAYPYAPSTIQQARGTLHTALEDLVPHILPYNPVKRVKLSRQQSQGQPVWDAEQVDLFEATAREMRPDLYFAYRLVLRRALRRGEVLAISATDIDTRRRLLMVEETAGDVVGETGETKGRKRREIPLGELLDDARWHRGRQLHPSDWMFPGQKPGKPFSLGQFNLVTNQICDAAGLPRITPKDMRATAATILLDQNVSLARVSRLLGHSTIAITAKFYDRILRSPQSRVDQLATDFDEAFKRASEAVSGSNPDVEVSPKVSDESATR